MVLPGRRPLHDRAASPAKAVSCNPKKRRLAKIRPHGLANWNQFTSVYERLGAFIGVYLRLPVGGLAPWLSKPKDHEVMARAGLTLRTSCKGGEAARAGVFLRPMARNDGDGAV